MQTTRLAVSLLFALAANAAAQSTPDLAGLWGATLRFGPDTRGPLIIYRTPEGWRADIAGFTVAVDGDRPATFAFELPDGKGYRREITRQQFEDLIRPILDRTIAPCKQVMKDAGVTPEQIEEVVLVGGSTRIPTVRSLVKEMFRPAELVERIRRLVHTNPAAGSKMEATL